MRVDEWAPKGLRSRGKASSQPVMRLGGLSGCNGPLIPGSEARHRSRARSVANGGRGGTDMWDPCGSEGKRERKWATDTWGFHDARVRYVAGGEPG
jgi:hypothetical protein